MYFFVYECVSYVGGYSVPNVTNELSLKFFTNYGKDDGGGILWEINNSELHKLGLYKKSQVIKLINMQNWLITKINTIHVQDGTIEMQKLYTTFS